ncbi:hypothetical protein HanPI659440_Chr06g0232141 [Helianthus annuus]|nr:hypothetical protein HanPI659440_Chr06g0232141 [Helianthus annuus]
MCGDFWYKKIEKTFCKADFSKFSQLGEVFTFFHLPHRPVIAIDLKNRNIYIGLSSFVNNPLDCEHK